MDFFELIYIFFFNSPSNINVGMGKIVTFRPEDSEADHSLLFASTKRDKEHPSSLIWKSLTCEQALHFASFLKISLKSRVCSQAMRSTGLINKARKTIAHINLNLSFTKHLTAYFKLEMLLCFCFVSSGQRLVRARVCFQCF